MGLDSPAHDQEAPMAQQEPEPAIVDTVRTDEATVATVIVTADGAESFPCPGGLTADELTD